LSGAAPPPNGRNATVASNGPIGADTRPSSRMPSHAPARTTASRTVHRPTPRAAARRPARLAVVGSVTPVNLAAAGGGAAPVGRGDAAVPRPSRDERGLGAAHTRRGDTVRRSWSPAGGTASAGR